MSALEKWYLAGPMTGHDDYNYPNFDKFSAELRTRGYQVVSPAEIGRELPGEPGSLPYYIYVREGLRGLLDCQHLVLMPGWTESRGARKELDIADFLDMKIWHIHEDGKLIRNTVYGNQDVD